MNPPIKLEVRTDNLRKCTLTVRGAGHDEEHTIVIPSDGNVYQGLCLVKDELQTVFNDVLAAHGVFPPPPPSEIPSPVDTTGLEAEVAALQGRKDAIEAHKASLERAKGLEAQKAQLEDELAKVPAEVPAVPNAEPTTTK